MLPGAPHSNTEAQERMSRQLFVAKSLSSAWTKRLNVFIKKRLPLLRSYKTYQGEPDPPPHDAEDVSDIFGLFTCFSSSGFLRPVQKPVTGCNLTDVRAAVERELKTLY